MTLMLNQNLDKNTSFYTTHYFLRGNHIFGIRSLFFPALLMQDCDECANYATVLTTGASPDIWECCGSLHLCGSRLLTLMSDLPGSFFQIFPTLREGVRKFKIPNCGIWMSHKAIDVTWRSRSADALLLLLPVEILSPYIVCLPISSAYEMTWPCEGQIIYCTVTGLL